MTLTNPFGVSRYLHPRRAGLIAYKGGSGGATTNITETGLGDTQFQTLQTNQSDIRGDITGLGTDNQTYGDALKTGQSGITNLIGSAASTDEEGLVTPATGLYGKFSDQYNYLTGLSDRMNTGFTDLTGNVNTQTSALASGQAGLASGQSGLVTGLGNLQDNVNTGLAGFTGRFDTIDQANTNMQTSVNEGFEDQAKGFTAVNANMASGFEDNQNTLNAGFEASNTAMNTGFSDAQSQLTNTQANVLAGQQGLNTALDTMGNTADIYAAQSLENQANLQSGQEGFVSNFDNYVDRYTDDVNLANQFRTDLEEAQTNAFRGLREDVGNFAEAASTANTGTQSAVDQLNTAVTGGFRDASVEDQIAKRNQTNDLNNIRDLLQTTGQSLDASTRDQYQKLADAFDQQGNLITQGIDDQGNTLRRELDAQGAVIETRFDQSGNQIGQFRMDVGQMISTANEFVSGQITDVGAATQARFDVQTGTMDTQVRDMAKAISSIQDLDVARREDLSDLSQAFDDQGRLIRSTVAENGVTTARAIDANGNLMLRAFDATGNELGNKVVDINQQLNFLGEYGYLPGANTSMGNLSPAVNANNGGFASPFTQTR